MSLIKSLNGDQFFLPLLTDRELEEMKSGMTKTEVKKLEEMERKRGLFNEKLSHFAVEDENERRSINVKKQVIQVEKEALAKEQYEKIVTITGTFEEIEQHYREHRNHMYRQRDRIRNLSIDVEKETRTLEYKRDIFKYDAFVAMMETENIKDEIEQKKRAKHDKNDPQWKGLLKGVHALPDVLIQHIGTYLTYETRAAVMEDSWQISDWFCRLKKRPYLTGVIEQIYRDVYVGCEESALKSYMKTLRKCIFTHCKNNLGKQKLLCPRALNHTIQYLFIQFRKHGLHEKIYRLYRKFAILQK
jgi:hypothetical protein